MIKKKKRVVKKRTESRKITVSLPEEVYFNIKHIAKEKIRTISQQTRLFVELGLQVFLQPHEEEQGQESEEKQPCIDFHVDTSDNDDE